jgi:flagellar hook-associated protein 3 FlgL
MRVTESLLYNQMTNDVNVASNNQETLEQELATGKQINQDSDNPAGASQDMSLRGLLVDINQYQTDASNAVSYMQSTSSSLTAAEELVQQARTIAVAAANGGTESSDQQAAYATQIQSIITQLTTTANSQYDGQYVFSGQQTSTAPYTQGDTTYTYNGDDNPIMSTIGANNNVQINVPGDQVFAPQFAALSQLETDITAGNYTAISTTDLTAIDSGLSVINTTQATVGANIDSVQNAESALTTTQSNYQSALANVEDANIATVYTQLQSAQNVYQASLIAVSKETQYTLAQYLQ